MPRILSTWIWLIKETTDGPSGYMSTLSRVVYLPIVIPVERCTASSDGFMCRTWRALLVQGRLRLEVIVT